MRCSLTGWVRFATTVLRINVIAQAALIWWCSIVLWNTVYLERAVQALRDSGKDIDDKLLSHLSPLGWEHINLTGDYVWQQSRQVAQGKFRPLRMLAEA